MIQAAWDEMLSQGEQALMLQRIMGPSLSGSSSPRQNILLWLLDLVDECTAILQNVGNFSPNNTASYLTRLQFSAKTVQQPQIPQASQCFSLAFIIQEQGILNVLVLNEWWPDFKYGLIESVSEKCKYSASKTVCIGHYIGTVHR